MKFQSLCATVSIPDEAADRRAGVRLGQYRLSAKALYWPSGDYLPLAAVTKAEATTGTLPTKGCCGLTLPVLQISVYCDGRKKNIPFDSQKQIERFLAVWQQAK